MLIARQYFPITKKIVHFMGCCAIQQLKKVKYNIPFMMTFHPFDNVDKSACLKCTNTEKRVSKWSRIKSVPTSLIAFLQSVKSKILITEQSIFVLCA